MLSKVRPSNSVMVVDEKLSRWLKMMVVLLLKLCPAAARAALMSAFGEVVIQAIGGTLGC